MIDWTELVDSQRIDGGYTPLFVDAKLMKNKFSVFKEFAQKLNFPSYFGNNWDALTDCLGDLSWMNYQNKITLFIINPKDLLLDAPASDFSTFLDVLLEVAKIWQSSLYLDGRHLDGEEYRFFVRLVSDEADYCCLRDRCPDHPIWGFCL